MKRFCLPLILIMMTLPGWAQKFTHADTLRGSNGPGRDWWDVAYYDLHVDFNIPDSSITGYNVISFKQVKPAYKYFQIDLQAPLVIDSVILEMSHSASAGNGSSQDLQHTVQQRRLYVQQDGNAWFARLDTTVKGYERHPAITVSDTARFQPSLTVYYHGRPRVARRPPWDGGIIWSFDKNKNPFVTVACQGTGASIWYPNKDWQGDEPDNGAAMHFTAPDSLVIVGNGRMTDSTHNADGTHTVSWAVQAPINNYEIIPYIGKYVHFGEVYGGEDGPLTMDYWVLDYNLEKAKEQFKQAPKMIEAFEYWFGPYPFYEDGYKLVEAPHLGMEHQSAVAYGNHFQNGYLGRDLSHSGWGLKWDFIIVHESGHEWFGNNITSRDIADMWVHEGFTNYSESLFTDYFYGRKAGDEYVTGTRQNIRNDRPVTGFYGVNNEGSGDMYYKGGNMIHTIRQVINNDDKFRQILRGLNRHFKHKIVTAREVEDYINEKADFNFDKVFEQYLTTTQIPTLEYKIQGNQLSYRWGNCVDGFNMPLKIANDKGEQTWIYPSGKFQTASGISKMEPDINFYILTKEFDQK